MNYTFVATQTELSRICDEFDIALQHDNRIAIDTEFVGEQTYEPQLMLIQIAAPNGRIALIDAKTLVGKMQSLTALLNAPHRLKIMHAGGQDVPILNANLGEIAGPWFDTQIAAAYIGYPLQTGYARLVEAETRVRLEKGESLSDWGRRPLPSSMLVYAADDVRYLHTIHQNLAQRLTQLDRNAWSDEGVDEMVRNVSEKIAPTDLWRKVSGNSSLDRRGLSVLRELCIWRDDEARRRDKPRRSVMKDEPLIELARRAPATITAAMNLRNLPPNLGDRRLAELIACIKVGLAVPPSQMPRLDLATTSLDDHGSALYELLTAVVRVRAIESNIAPTLLAPADPLRRLAASRRVDDVARVFGGWREQLIGNDLRDVLNGNLSVAWDTRAEQLVCRRNH
ncbi:MAG: HRDC domain-containing protein [Anaerolineae bacterium]|nr:HRDC domain-containing protein [Anaerolineae bacterium]